MAGFMGLPDFVELDSNIWMQQCKMIDMSGEVCNGVPPPFVIQTRKISVVADCLRQQRLFF